MNAEVRTFGFIRLSWGWNLDSLGPRGYQFPIALDSLLVAIPALHACDGPAGGDIPLSAACAALVSFGAMRLVEVVPPPPFDSHVPQ